MWKSNFRREKIHFKTKKKKNIEEKVYGRLVCFRIFNVNILMCCLSAFEYSRLNSPVVL